MQFARHRIEQRLEVAALVIGGNARLRQRDVTGAEALGGTRAGGLVFGAVEQGVHARLVVARGQERAEHVERIALGILRHSIAAPGLAHQPFGIGAVAACDHRFRQRKAALGRDRRLVLEPRPHGGVVALVVPQRRLEPAAHEGLRRPARILREEGAIALDGDVVVLAAQDQPFGELFRHRILEPRGELSGLVGLALADQLDDVFQRLLVGLRCRRGRSHRGGSHLLAGRGNGGMLARGRRQRMRRGGRCRRALQRRGAGLVAAAAGRGRRRRGCRLGHDVAGDRPRLWQRNLWLGPSLGRDRQRSHEHQAGRQRGRSQCGCADRSGHGFP